jgi:PAS domain S-box-containing protein
MSEDPEQQRARLLHLEAALHLASECSRLLADSAVAPEACFDELTARIGHVQDATCTLALSPADTEQLPEPQASSGAHSVPLEINGTHLGRLDLLRASKVPFTEEDQAVVAGIARQIALAVAYARSARAVPGKPDLARVIVNKLPAMLAYWDATLHCRFANRAYETWFGVSAEAMIGQTMPEFLGPLYKLNQRYVEGALRGEEQTFEREIPDPSGGPPRHSQASYVPDIFEGRVRGFCVLVVDITARKRAEVALAAAKETADAANRELESFSYSVAHDLRTPLRGMSGFAELLLNEYGDRVDGQGHAWLNDIVLNAAKMARLIDALLSLARLSRSGLRKESVALSEVVREELARLAASDPSRDVTVVLKEELRASADPDLVRGLVANLLGNAWKFTSTHPTARIEFGEVEAKGGRAFFLRDDGVGFDMECGNKLFVAFQRLHSAREFPGAGIGLATVQRIVKRHGGEVWAESKVNGGATFFFTLPE